MRVGLVRRITWIFANLAKPLFVGPDSESEQWAAEVAEAWGAPYAMMSKRRLGDPCRD